MSHDTRLTLHDPLGLLVYAVVEKPSVDQSFIFPKFENMTGASWARAERTSNAYTTGRLVIVSSVVPSVTKDERSRSEATALAAERFGGQRAMPLPGRTLGVLVPNRKTDDGELFKKEDFGSPCQLTTFREALLKFYLYRKTQLYFDCGDGQGKKDLDACST